MVALVQEMPWLREANLNLEIFFRHLDPSGTNLMPEFQRELRKRISEHGWTTDGMAEIGINLSFPINTNAHDTQ
ncbi:MAG: hypothetical protein H7Y11_09975 [Armatimonadetes bacterium]|nr:hypothetical protein [Anaerolineae bacterium]